MFGPDSVRRRWSVDEVTVTHPDVIKRAIGAAAIGNITEWYDFGVYSYMALTIGDVIMPLEGSAATLMTYALMAVAFLFRPLGGIILGPLSDRIGRNKVLAMTMIMMAGATVAIGLIPDYAHAGVWACVLLFLCRVLQGFSTGGEYGNAMTFIAEYAPDKKRGFLGSLLEVGTFTGYLLGAGMSALVMALCTTDQLHSWGWRLPFFLALPLGFIGVYLRSKLGDTPAFEALEAESEQREKDNKVSLKDTFKMWPAMLVCGGLVIAWNVTNYMLTAYMPSFLSTVTDHKGGEGISDNMNNVSQIIVMAICLAIIPLIGLASDRIGRKTIVRIGSVMLIVLAFPSLMLITRNTEGSVIAGLIIMGLSLICFSATMPSTLPSLFPTAVRAGALSIAFNIFISAFCGTTALYTGALVDATGNLMWPAYILIIAGVIGLVSVHFLPESNGRPLWGSAPSVEHDHEAQGVVKDLHAEADQLKAAGVREDAPYEEADEVLTKS